MKIISFLKSKPMQWSVIIFLLTQALTLVVISHENVFLKKENIYLPSQPTQAITIWPTQTTSASGQVTQIPAESSLLPILIYFLSAVIVIGIVLFVIPVSALKTVFKVIFAFLFTWSIFVISILWLPLIASILIAAFIGIFWFFNPRVWLHSLVMLLAMVALGEVFGRFISPWTAMVLLTALAIYDFLAVRFGYMMWMVKKMSESTTLPAFIIPYKFSEWTSSLKKTGIIDLVEQRAEERKYSILGGGDIGFPVLLVSSVYFAHGLSDGLIVAGFALVGLVSAYFIQAKFLKGNAMPALPPIAVMSIIGLVLIGLVH
jgi:presenilin-like A22 family membrane protease